MCVRTSRRLQASFKKFGLAPNASGVEIMKNAVHRRIAEATPQSQRRLELLANEARRCLGIQPMPDTRSKGSAEVLFAGMINGDSTDGITKPTESDTPEDVQAAIQRALQDDKVSAACAEHLSSMLRAGSEPVVVRSLLSMADCGLPCSTLSGADDAPPLAGVAPGMPSPCIDVLREMPTAFDFFERYVRPSRPCVMRLTELDAEHWPPLRDLPDFGYLRQRCGHRRVLVKSLAIDDCKGRPVFVSALASWASPRLALPRLASPCLARPRLASPCLASK